MIGQTISHYKITEKLGEGGMGVVYRAEDTKLGRTVALKFLAAHLLNDAEAKQRFLREARAAASLSHANICTVHEIDEADGKTFLAMEFVEGETLEDRIAKGPVALKDVLDIGRQVADGLEAAHEKGIVHRDIKPANVLLDAKGRATIMDFGLARLTEASRLTKADTTMGTVAYMSPEQAQGSEVDHRSDIWALGCVLYEMVCGWRPFRGQYDQALLYEIVNEEPEPLTGVRAGVPMELEFIVGKCLAKEASERYQNAGDLIVDLTTLSKKTESGRSRIVRSSAQSINREQSLGGRSSSAPASPEQHATGGEAAASFPAAVPTPRLTNRERLLVGVSAVLLIALVVVSFLRFGEPTSEPGLRRFSFTPENLHPLPQYGIRGRAVISPNGRHIVYLARGGEPALWVRDIGREEPRMLAGTEGARHPGLFWSPDSRFIGFAAGGALKKVPVGGGPAITLCALPPDYFGYFDGGSWATDGAVAFVAGLPPQIFEVSDQGGEPKLLFEREVTERGRGNWFPSFLPGDSAARAMVFGVGTVNDQEIAVKNLENGEFAVLVVGAFPAYSPSGHIVYQTNALEAGLWALPFSIETLRATGEAFRVTEDLADPSVAEDGALVAVDFEGTPPRQLAWFDRAGRKLGVMGRPQQGMSEPAISPDGRRVAVAFAQDGNADIWVHDVDRSVDTRLTFDRGNEGQPVWSPSGEEIAFNSNRRGNLDLFLRSADGSGEATLLTDTPELEFPKSWSADGRILLYDFVDPRTGSDIRYLERGTEDGTFQSHVFLQTPFFERNAQISPNAQFVAYDSNESGRDEIYVRAFSQGTEKWQVTANGGRQPLWSKDGAELFYVAGETLMAVSVSKAGSFSAGSPKPLFRHPGLRDIDYRYDVSADGQRFLVVEDVEDEQAKRPAIHIVENWYEEFRDRQQP